MSTAEVDKKKKKSEAKRAKEAREADALIKAIRDKGAANHLALSTQRYAFDNVDPRHILMSNLVSSNSLHYYPTWKQNMATKARQKKRRINSKQKSRHLPLSQARKSSWPYRNVSRIRVKNDSRVNKLKIHERVKHIIIIIILNTIPIHSLTVNTIVLQEPKSSSSSFFSVFFLSSAFPWIRNMLM
jgi:hypothetical protein